MDRYRITCTRSDAEQILQQFGSQDGVHLEVEQDVRRLSGATEALAIIASLSVIAKNSLDIWIASSKLRKENVKIEKL